MNIYNEENVLKDFNKLVELYLNDDTNKNDIYGQMLFLYNINASLARKNNVRSYKPKGYIKSLKENELLKKQKYKELDKLTRILCYNLNKEIDKYCCFGYRFINNDKYSYEEYFKIIRDFLSNVFPSDLELFNKDIANGNIIIKKDMFFSSADIYYLEMLKKYYIIIRYCKNLDVYNLASIIHEYGHASTFINGNVYESKGYIMNEVISTLYELLFLNYYLYNYSDMSNYKEIMGVFNFSCIYKLKNKIFKGYGYNNYTISMLEALYGQLIAVTIYIKYRDKDILDKIKLLKDNYFKIDGFELLRSINITENDLINTSSDIGKLILNK